jgi:hypothetical protein
MRGPVAKVIPEAHAATNRIQILRFVGFLICAGTLAVAFAFMLAVTGFPIWLRFGRCRFRDTSRP